MAWHQCPVCGSRMEVVVDPKTLNEVESCPDDFRMGCPYHRPGSRDGRVSN